MNTIKEDIYLLNINELKKISKNLKYDSYYQIEFEDKRISKFHKNYLLIYL